MGVIGSAADDGVEVFLVEALAPVHVGRGVGEFRGGKGEVLLVHVAKGDEPFSLAMPSKWASPRPQVPRRAMLSLLLGASAPKEFGAREDKAGSAGKGLRI